MTRVVSFARPRKESKVRSKFNEDWHRVNPDMKHLLMVGRTRKGLWCRGVEADVEDLVKQYGYDIKRCCWNQDAWDSLSPLQQLDFLATEILRRDRLASGVHHIQTSEYLSPTQARLRKQREITIPEDAFDALIEHHTPRIRKVM